MMTDLLPLEVKVQGERGQTGEPMVGPEISHIGFWLVDYLHFNIHNFSEIYVFLSIFFFIVFASCVAF